MPSSAIKNDSHGDRAGHDGAQRTTSSELALYKADRGARQSAAQYQMLKPNHFPKKIAGLFLLMASGAGLAITAHAQAMEEVPFITSPDNVTLEMLSSAGVRKGDHVIDLGSGDGGIAIPQTWR